MNTFASRIAVETQRPLPHVENVLSLIKDGATVPFIARYRKEMTGSMDEEVIRTIRDRDEYLTQLEERRTVVLKSIEEQGKLTPELAAQLQAADSLQRVEDLYLPYRPKRRTRAMMAREKGLEPLAQQLREQAENVRSLDDLALPYVNAELGVENPQQALAGAGDIIAEELSDRAEVRAWLRDHVARHGVYTSVPTEAWAGKKSKFEVYYDYRRAAKDVPSHALLALRRGEREEVLSVKLEIEAAPVVAWLERQLIRTPGTAYVSFLAAVAADAWTRLLKPSVTNEVDAARKQDADETAIRTFAVNLRHLLLASPAGEKVVLGIDPGFRTGCKVAVVDRTGKFLENSTIYPTEPRHDEAGAGRVLLEMIRKHGVELIAIGNGTGGRETDAFVGRLLAAVPAEGRPGKVMVSESGASVYSASDVARDEFPDLDLTVRGAISIARRLQDPLAELVKIEPKSIGVGQYQHDVEQKALGRSLEEVVESCVNHVGVDLNTASAPLLRFVSGVNATLAKNVVAYRNEHGTFRRRRDLMAVPRFGPKAFQQAAGFLRIRDAGDPLDNSAVHPERYAVVERMARDLGISVRQLVGNASLVERIDLSRYVEADLGMETLADIQQELLKPGRDPRREFRYADFNEQVTELKDLQPGMVLDGVVTNVAAFGAFVDLGVHQDGLVHVSELAWRFVRDAGEVVRVGDPVKVKVLSVDLELKRISLSIKQTQAPPAAPARPPAPSRPAAPPPPREKPREEPSAMRDKLRAWQQRPR